MELTRDDFLNGRVTVWQPATGYRAATDPVLLAAACPAISGESVLELGCGVGVASLCLAARVLGAAITGVELQPDYADLARRNAHEAGFDFAVVEADLASLPEDLRARSFDHVIANPPFFNSGSSSPDAGRSAARHEATPLSDWIATGRKRLRPKGWLTIILPANRLPDLMNELQGTFGDISVLPLAARDGRDAGRVVVKARKSGRGPFRLLPPLILHSGPEHVQDGDDYSPKARAILRDGHAIDWS